MPITDIKRPNYYEGQYLGAQDLLAAQDYQRHQDQRHRLAAHTWGIAVGLELEERPRAGGAVDVYIKPGYAVDGFGRTIVLLEPYKLSDQLFGQFLPDPNLPDGRWIRIWLRHREDKTNPPRPGFQICDVEEQWYRIRETFRVVVGDLTSISQQRDPITVAGRTIDAAVEVPDTSVPYQALPGGGEEPRWLIPLGYVRWSGTDFVESKTEDEKKKTRDGRRYIGVVAASVLAPDRALRIGDRFSVPLPTDPNDPRYPGVAVGLEGSLRVDRLFTAKQDAHVEGRLAVGTTVPAGRVTINGTVQPQQGSLTIFSQDADFSYDGGNDRLFIFKDTAGGQTAFIGGNLGIGTTNPLNTLHVARSSHLNAIFDRTDTSDHLTLVVGSDGSGFRFANSNFFFIGSEPYQDRNTTSVGRELLRITAEGNVGIGTADPLNTLHVARSSHLNAIFDRTDTSDHLTLVVGSNGSGFRFADSNFFFIGTQPYANRHDNTTGSELFRITPEGTVGIGTTNPQGRLTIRGIVQPEQGSLTLFSQDADFSYDGGSDDLFIFSDTSGGKTAFMGGSVGIGTTTPGARLEVNGTTWLDGYLWIGGSMRVEGHLHAQGGKTGYIAERFINKVDEPVERGDVVVLSGNQASLFYGLDKRIPIFEVDLTSQAVDTRVCGIVDELLKEDEDEGGITREGPKKMDRSKVAPGQTGLMVTLGAYAWCKVDADFAPIEVGDLLTTSSTRGHARKVPKDSEWLKPGAILGKALGALSQGKGIIPVLVTLQ